MTRDPRIDPKRGDIVRAPGLGMCTVIGDRGDVYLTVQNVVDTMLGNGRRRIPRSFWRKCMADPRAEVIS